MKLIELVLADADTNGDGKLDFREFYTTFKVPDSAPPHLVTAVVTGH
jgi:hypothetical protein